MINIQKVREAFKPYSGLISEYDIVTEESYDAVLKELQKIYSSPDSKHCNKGNLSEYFAGWWTISPTIYGFSAIFIRPFTD